MLQHLRFHRRGPSNPTSPIPDSSPWGSSSLSPANLVPQDAVPAPDIRPRSASGAPFAPSHGPPPTHPTPSHPPQSSHQQPPCLPPITRVVSDESERSMERKDPEPKPSEDSKPEPKPLLRSPYNEQSGFIGGLALEKYRREQAALNSSPSEKGNVKPVDPQPPRSDLAMSSPPSRPPPPAKPLRTATSFVSPTDLQHAPPIGKRPPGARMSDSQGAVVPAGGPAQSRSRKGLPFLKNPMSTLLLRRKASQNMMPELTLPTRPRSYEPAKDPRIRGTRIHDFSAPRPKRVVSSNNFAGLGVDQARQDAISPASENQSPAVEAPPVPPKDEQAHSTRASSSTHSKARSMDATLSLGSQKSADTQLSSLTKAEKADLDAQRRKSSIPASLASISRNVSEASTRDKLSLPKHMKSTSSRFSFDMIGSAQQEKLLEEKHRQRQQDKVGDKVVDEPTERRDSRFDDFDEDTFDYDAMDYDDGLEERIPGVNADLDEEEDVEAANDPDNDQENFAGFVFQRSDPTSALTSPLSAGILPTPRDASGNVIGYAVTGGTPDLEAHLPSPLEDSSEDLSEKLPEQTTPTGLGIQGFENDQTPQPAKPQRTSLPIEVPRTLSKDDELYFNGGMDSFEGEGDGSAFDESIFDLDDTDRFGRPIPGMFANALSQRNAAQEAQKRESDMTSRLSAQSGASKSTGHTSPSVDAPAKSAEPLVQEEETSQVETLDQALDQARDQPLEQPAAAPGEDQMAAYQAALAAAAYKAVASGKFRRDSSPTPPAELTVTSPTTSGSSHSHPDAMEDSLDDYEREDDFSNGLDDYEMDDDAIIAEANASALANDSDGWYGQEFGFYSAPGSQQGHHGQNLLSKENLFEYSAGGYFGPSGVNRTKSGRLASREPNLTPITERSEYSNRNSLMSLGMPPGPNSAGPLQSPGLAQLAMMADDDNISLSALMRLRSKAWGGSQVSLASSRDASPHERNGATSPWAQDVGGNGPSHGRKNSAFSLYSQDSAGGSGSGSPTLPVAMPSGSSNAVPPLHIAACANPNPATSTGAPGLFSPMQPSPACPPVFEDDETSPQPVSLRSSVFFADSMSPTTGVPSQKRPGMGHRHRGSADSISYTKEEESGETRWILERRRTAESGEIEILGREVVGNGRI
ncbi:hypothetical protein F4780DRAFT_762900 [Xylariomycetidae sp. FL0641]|nr:hypothetical protein F4780DRAFT_762900 [Xylariomycetidae sp. FL0641]